MSRTSLLKVFRVTHLYFGVFITPALLFFAFTGAIQSFGLHETNRDHPNYKPAHWITVLAQIHKKQTDVLPSRKPQQKPEAAPAFSPASPVSAPSESGSHAHSNLQSDAKAPASGIPASPSATPSVLNSEPRHGSKHDAQSSPESSVASTPQESRPQPVPPASAPQTPAHNPVPLRIFFVIVCLGLFTSTLTGLYMTYNYVRNRRLVTVTLLAGIIIPLLLLLF